MTEVVVLSLFPQSLHERHLVSVPDPIAGERKKNIEGGKISQTMLMKINQFNSVMTFIHVLFQPHLVIFKLFPLKHQVICPPNISPVREKRRIITKSYGPSCDCACFCISKCACVCICLPADMFHSTLTLLLQLHKSANGFLQFKDCCILHHNYGFRRNIT